MKAPRPVRLKTLTERPPPSTGVKSCKSWWVFWHLISDIAKDVTMCDVTKPEVDGESPIVARMDGDAINVSMEDKEGVAMEMKCEEEPPIYAVTAAESILTLTAGEEEDEEMDEKKTEDKFTQVTFCTIHNTFLSLKGGRRRGGKRRHSEGEETAERNDADSAAPRAKRKALKRRMGLIAASLGNMLLSQKRAGYYRA